MYGENSNIWGDGMIDVFNAGSKVLPNGEKVFEKFELNMKNVPKKNSNSVVEEHSVNFLINILL